MRPQDDEMASRGCDDGIGSIYLNAQHKDAIQRISQWNKNNRVMETGAPTLQLHFARSTHYRKGLALLAKECGRRFIKEGAGGEPEAVARFCLTALRMLREDNAWVRWYLGPGVLDWHHVRAGWCATYAMMLWLLMGNKDNRHVAMASGANHFYVVGGAWGAWERIWDCMYFSGQLRIEDQDKTHVLTNTGDVCEVFDERHPNFNGCVLHERRWAYLPFDIWNCIRWVNAMKRGNQCHKTARENNPQKVK